MRRRELVYLIGAGSAAWLLTGAQALTPSRKVGALWPFSEDDPEAEAVKAAFYTGMKELGWTNAAIENRWGGGDAERTKAYAKELVDRSPDVIFAYFNAQLAPLSHVTHTIPIVFVGASDPVGAGYIASLSHPGGNITGFTLYESTLAGKWLGVLKEIAPPLSRVALLVNPDTAVLHGTFYKQALESAAAAMGIGSIMADVYNASDLEQTIASLAQQQGSVLIVAPDTFSEVNGDRIVALAAQYRLPAVYAISRYARHGGLVSYGPNLPNAVSRATTYIDRILRGEKAADLPVQAPVKYELAVNLKAARGLGLTISEAFLLRADEVIE
jgi:putative tryptophan/tyrosine transport system substrate-binding protein